MGTVTFKSKPFSEAFSKQTQTTPEIPSDNTAQSKLVYVSSPFIDKISITVPLMMDQDYPFIKGTALAACINEKERFEELTKSLSYEIKGRIRIGDLKTKKLPFFEMLPTKSGMPYFRIEFNPSKIGIAGLDELDKTLSLLILEGFNYLFEYGRVTRIDVAVDVTAVSMDDFLFLKSHAKTTQRYLSNGRIETLYFGKKYGNHTIIYDKQREQQEKKKRVFPNKVIRVETVLMSPNLSLKKLVQLGNPFHSLSVIQNFPPRPQDLPANKHWMWEVFRDSVQVRGAHAALKLVPEERRAVFTKYLKKYPSAWWDSDKLWKNREVYVHKLFAEVPSAKKWLSPKVIPVTNSAINCKDGPDV